MFYNIQKSLDFFIDDVRLPKFGYVKTISAPQIMSPAPIQPPNMFVYQAPHKRWCYWQPSIIPNVDIAYMNDNMTAWQMIHQKTTVVENDLKFTVPAVITPDDYEYICYDLGEVVYNYNVYQETGKYPTAQYTYKLVDYRNGDLSSFEGDDLAEIKPPSIVAHLSSGREEPVGIGSRYERHYRNLNYMVWARNPREKTILRGFFEDTLGPKFKEDRLFIRFSVQSVVDDNGNINALFDINSQTDCLFLTDNKRINDLKSPGTVLTDQYRFRCDVRVDTIE